MDMSYATILIEGIPFRLYGENKMLHLIEDPNNASLKALYTSVDVDNFVGFFDGKEHKIEECKCL